jgi:uncharacterized protein YbaR (Trm112 family)
MTILPTKSTDLVLEIGSGHNPHPRADILCDRYLYENTQRQRMAIRCDRPLVVADGQKLPFADRTFDFVICSQILEHMPDPIKFAQEVSRVSKAGLIIVPHALRERIFGWEYHRWYFYEDDGIIFTIPKNPDELSPFSHFMHRLFNNSPTFRRHLKPHERRLNIYYFWKDTIQIQRSKRTKLKFLKETDEDVKKILSDIQFSKIQDGAFLVEEYQKRAARKLDKLKRHKAWNETLKLNPDFGTKKLLQILVCPICNNKLLKVGNKLECKTAKHSYPLEKSIPIMLTAKELKKGY